MQPVNIEQQQANVRLPRQLPANTIKEITSPIHQKHVNKNLKASPNRSKKITGENIQQWPSQPSQTDLADFDTHRSLSSCPTYSSLSRHSPETRECATQITTLTPIETIEDDQEILDDSPLSIDNNQVLLVDEIPFEEVELMPVSSGFGYYPYDYPTTKTNRILRPQIVDRAPKFRTNPQDRTKNDFNGNSQTKPIGKSSSSRPTAVRVSPPSDVVGLPPKRNQINNKLPKNNSIPNGFRQVPPKQYVARNATPPPEKHYPETTRKNDNTRPVQKYLSSPSIDQEDLGRRPVHFANKRNDAYYPSSPTPYYRKPVPVYRDGFDKPQRMHIANNEYVIQRRRQPSSDYIYDDRRTDSPIERTKPRKVIRILQDPSYREDDDVYYTEPAPPRRAPIVRRSPQPEYVYVDETPAQIRHHRPRRQEVVYVHDDQPVEDDQDYIYVDEHGNEVDLNNERPRSADYVEYVYDDEKDKRRSHKSKVIYVDDDAPPINQGRSKRKPKQSSTRIVYE